MRHVEAATGPSLPHVFVSVEAILAAGEGRYQLGIMEWLLANRLEIPTSVARVDRTMRLRVAGPLLGHQSVPAAISTPATK